MVLEKQIYELGNRPQLIDLNKNYKNFRLQFQVVSLETNQEFQALVMNQEQVENTTDLNKIEMKIAPGKIGGNIVADNDKYQNYYLVMRNSLKAPDTIVKVEVTKNIEEINDPSPESSSSSGKELQDNNGTNEDVEEEYPVQDQIKVVPFYRKPWFWGCIALLVFLIFLYYYYVIRAKGEQMIPDTKDEEAVVEAITTDGQRNDQATTTTTCRNEEVDKKEKLYQRLAGIQ